MKAINQTKIPTVSDIMVREVICLKTTDNIFTAVSLMRQQRLSSTPVIDEANSVVGFLSEADCLRHLGNMLFFDEGGSMSVGQAMSPQIQGVHPEWDIFKLENFFLTNNLRHAPVINEDRMLIGTVSRHDILKCLESLAKERADYQERKIRPQVTELTISDRMKLAAHVY